MALGLRARHPSQGRTDSLPAARHALPASRHPARGSGLSAESGWFWRRGIRARTGTPAPGTLAADARYHQALGPRIEPGRAVVAGICAHGIADPAVGAHRRHTGFAR